MRQAINDITEEDHMKIAKNDLVTFKSSTGLVTGKALRVNKKTVSVENPIPVVYENGHKAHGYYMVPYADIVSVKDGNPINGAAFGMLL